MTGMPRGFGFVTMGNQESFDAVMGAGQMELNGKWMELKPADPGSRPGGGPGGPGSGGPGGFSSENGVQTKNLHVSNLAPGTTKEELESLFGAHGEVREVVLKAAGQFAFVNMVSEDGASACVAALHGTDLRGQALAVKLARERRYVDRCTNSPH